MLMMFMLSSQYLHEIQKIDFFEEMKNTYLLSTNLKIYIIILNILKVFQIKIKKI